MTITLSPELEARLLEVAARDGTEPNELAEVLLSAALDWEAQERREAIEGIRRGLEASAAGRVRPASAVFADMRAKLNRPEASAALWSPRSLDEIARTQSAAVINDVHTLSADFWPENESADDFNESIAERRRADRMRRE